MELLPPKPPKLAGTEKAGLDGGEVKKKYSSKTSSESMKTSKKSSKLEDSNLLNAPSVDLLLPPIEKMDEALDQSSIDERINDNSVSLGIQPKKRGFLSRLFGKKEQDANMSSKPDYVKKSEEEELEHLRESLGMTDPSRKIALQDMEKTPDYVSRTSWDSQIVDISSYRKPADYAKDSVLPVFNIAGKKESKKEDAKSAKKVEKKEEKKVEKKEDKKDVKQETKALMVVEKLTPATKPELKERIPQQTTSEVKIMKKKEEKTIEDIESNWDMEAIEAIEAARRNAKLAKQIDAKFKKLMNVYTIKISKMVKDKKKSLSIDISKIDQRVKELSKKETALAIKEQKIKNSDLALQQRKKEIELLSRKEESVKKNKAQLEADIEKYKRILTQIRSDMFNAKKSYDYEKKEFIVKRRDLQTEMKRFEDMHEREIQSGEEELAEISSKVEQAQANLDSITKKNQAIMAELKSREMALENKEKKVNELLSQEKKMLSMLRGNSKQMPSEEDLFTKKKIVDKPVKIVQEQSGPEIYVDDEDALNQKIQDCKDLLREENYEDAKMLYNEIREDFLKANIDDSRKTEVKHEIRELYDEICIGIVAPKN
ncbi:MAG: hypothetical protein ACP5N2_04705 [Candidatus Nanoarchaeia archaeon]